ncbi:type 1 periplasmic-binding domain-containing protein [Propionibacterium australiense]|uniref:PBP1_ABC_transporter_LIVBP_like n=1 Tax=Propionibacterium australiense TaxID=119981 RepID=A0A383SB04_9ACTN|nr:ABC transporter substrate-binding protein [Propionibacterium australiense]RLP06095.1 amino acid ABC transporter substrate-binding protein [Propionibacterium australiense]SYZ34604.1 PBP1_ABC_transporter_LIVBP_like [Propionibacterium australiense]VEH89799.1 Uncharacterised protein [Propionibacterium australiense]
MSARTRLAGRVAALAMALVLTVSGCGGDDSTNGGGSDNTPAESTELALRISGVPSHLNVGVIVSLGTGETEGSQWADNANGIQVAAYRLGLAGTEVEFTTIDDRGDSAEAVNAVQALSEAGVAGIVMATSGDHVDAALARANELGVPVIAPYVQDTGALGETAWITGPSTDQVRRKLGDALASQKATAPLLVDAGSGEVSGIAYVGRADASAGDFATTIQSQIESAGADSVIVSGPATRLGAAVAGLQNAGVQVPIICTPDALSAQFSQSLVDNNASLSAPLLSVGTNTSDAAALTSGADGNAISAYLSGVRVMAAQNKHADLSGERTFSEVAQAADIASHDALVVLADAAAEAGSTKPAKITEAMGELVLGHDDGLAGAPLDLRKHAGLPDGPMAVLSASSQDLGLRPSTTTRTLVWFTTASS